LIIVNISFILHRNAISCAQTQYDKHLVGWKEYQFNRDRNSTILGDKVSVLLRSSGGFECTSSPTPKKESLWTAENVKSGSRKKPFKHPVIGKVFRETTIPEPKNFVVKTLSKARKCFPKKDQTVPYTDSEMRLFQRWCYMFL
jgi:hypothetical protein